MEGPERQGIGIRCAPLPRFFAKVGKNIDLALDPCSGEALMLAGKPFVFNGAFFKYILKIFLKDIWL